MNDKRNPDAPAEAEAAAQAGPKKAGGKRLAGAAPHEAQEYRGKRLLPSDEDLPEEDASGAASSEEDASSASGGGKPMGRWFARLQDAALDLGDQVLDWRDEMTDRFSDMASDPENESLPARMIRQSEQIVSGIEDQERETDELASEERARRTERTQKAAEHLNPDGVRPKFLFYTMENAPTDTSPGTPIELKNPTLIDRDGNIVSSGQTDAPAAGAAEAAGTPDTAEQTAEPAEAAGPAAQAAGSAETVPPPSAESPVHTDSPKPAEAAPKTAPPASAGTAPEKAADTGRTAARERPLRQRTRRTDRPRADAPDRPPVPPSQKEHRQLMTLSRTVQYWLFFAVLGIAAVAGLIMPFRAETSALEGRTLTEQAGVSFSGFVNGSWFTEFDRWYNDTFPGRDRLAGLYDGIGAVFGFDNGSTVNEEAADTADASESDSSAEDSDASADEASDASADETAEDTDASADEAAEDTDDAADETAEDTDGVSV